MEQTHSKALMAYAGQLYDAYMTGCGGIDRLDKPTTPMPTVHMNGTSHKMLNEGYEDAYFALNTFIKAFGHIEFNARDYYPQGPDAWNDAADARTDMNVKIRDLVKYVEDHLESLAEQAPKK